MVKIKRDAGVAAVILLAHSEPSSAPFKPYLLRQQAVHDEEQRPLQAVEESENVCLHEGLLPKQEGPEHPHQAQYTHLGNGCHRESSADGGEEKTVSKEQQQTEKERKTLSKMTRGVWKTQRSGDATKRLTPLFKLSVKNWGKTKKKARGN